MDAARPRDPSSVSNGPLGPATSLAHLFNSTCPIAPVAERSADATPLLILYTSGTTGLPKGAVLGAAGVAANLDALARVWRWGPAHPVVHALPLFHVHGLVLGWFGSLRVGGRMVWLPHFDPTTLAAALTEACLAEHPEVREVAVIGLEDPDLGERIIAFVVPRDPGAPPPPDTLIQFVAAALAPHKRPRLVIFLEALPRNAMGKVLKPALRAHHL